MRKVLITVLVILLSTLLLGLVLLVGFGVVLGMIYGGDPVLESLPDYESKELYSSGGFGDYTDYGKYRYENVDASVLESSEYFAEVAPGDLENIGSYLDYFENRVSVIGGELEQGYDFDRSLVSAGDYFHIRTKEGEPIGTGGSVYRKFDNYTLFYFDPDSGTLYYFHSNI